MDSVLSAIGIVLIIILFAFVIMVVQARSIESSFLTGVWIGTPEFCTDSQLSAFILKLDQSDYDGKRAGYLLAVNDTGVILNHPVIIDFEGISVMPHLARRDYNITIDWLEETPPSFFPNQQILSYDAKQSKIIMHGEDDTVYAILTKNYDYIPKETD